MRSKFKVTKWVPLPIYSHPFHSMPISHPTTPGIQLLQNLTLKMQYQGHIVGSTSCRLVSLLFHVQAEISLHQCIKKTTSYTPQFITHLFKQVWLQNCRLRTVTKTTFSVMLTFNKCRTILQDESANMSPWWPLLGLLSWCPICKSIHCNLIDDWAPADEIYGCPIFK